MTYMLCNIGNTQPLFIPVADCAAVAFFDPDKHVIGLVHAGWKGIVYRIIIHDSEDAVSLRSALAQKVPEWTVIAV
ncbi:laccase domain-containing protein [Tengunoibacter tsumagoiensis]|uniref:Uncharacterized protein n=1 Tax=Tengunoibacter tsumagoiensis TaxID=2014871 RepID=A0A402A927_9CHLR|nr:hypothetical protein KTT_55360 [Tengunoibacter tsumagoiensis]